MQENITNHGMVLCHKTLLIIADIVMIHELMAFKLIFHLFPGADLAADEQPVPFRNQSSLR